MLPPDLFLIFTRKFQELGLRYMVSGSVASIIYGEPRMTNDVDIIIFLRKSDIPAVVAAFPIEEFYCPPAEVIYNEMLRPHRGHLKLIHHATGFKADLYLAGTDELRAWGMANSRVIELENDRIVVAPPEYVIVRKLEFFREGGSQSTFETSAGCS